MGVGSRLVKAPAWQQRRWRSPAVVLSTRAALARRLCPRKGWANHPAGLRHSRSSSRGGGVSATPSAWRGVGERQLLGQPHYRHHPRRMGPEGQGLLLHGGDDAPDVR